MEFLKAHLATLRFTERSSLARIGIEMVVQGAPTVDGNRLLLSVEAFLYDHSFPNAPYWQKLLRPGVPVGRLFYAPATAKLSATEIWTAIRENPPQATQHNLDRFVRPRLFHAASGQLQRSIRA